jgi:CRISPR-associated protein Csd2
VLLYDVENGNTQRRSRRGQYATHRPGNRSASSPTWRSSASIRNYVELVRDDAVGYRIYIKEGTATERKT